MNSKDIIKIVEFDLTGDSDDIDVDDVGDNVIDNVTYIDLTPKNHNNDEDVNDEPVHVIDLTPEYDEPDKNDDDDKSIAYLAVPYEEKDAVKSHGAFWDTTTKRWCIAYKNIKNDSLQRWIIDESIYPNEIVLDIPYGNRFSAQSIGAIKNSSSNAWICPKGINPDLFEPYHVEYLNIPYSDKDEAKELGAKFDWEKKKWYVMKSKINLFQKWKSQTPSNLEKRKRDDDHLVNSPSYVDEIYDDYASFAEIMEYGRQETLKKMKKSGCPLGHCFEYWNYGSCMMRDGSAKVGCPYKHEVINLNFHY